jgi:hypothetical protein
MANYPPVALVSGTIKVMDSTTVVNPAFFSVTRSVAATSNSFATLLPDPYFVQTQSANISVSTNNVSSSIMTFTVPTRQEKQYYMLEGILAVSSVSASVTGPKISLQRDNVDDGFFTIRTATSLTTVSVLNQGSADNTATASMATVVANNTPVPVNLRGVFFNSTSQGTFNNTIFIQPSASINVTSRSGSTFYAHFAGISSSLTPFTSSRAPIALLSGTLDSIAGGDLVTQSVLPPTSSYWVTSSLGTQVTNSSNTAWVTVFTLTGMTDNKRYLVNYFIRCQAAATTTGVWLRAASGSNYTGLLYSLSSGNNSAPSIASSSGSAIITNTIPTGIPSANSDRIFWGEYTVTKAAGSNPTIELQSEVNTSQVLVNSGSLVLWRLLE